MKWFISLMLLVAFMLFSMPAWSGPGIQDTVVYADHDIYQDANYVLADTSAKEVVSSEASIIRQERRSYSFKVEANPLTGSSIVQGRGSLEIGTKPG